MARRQIRKAAGIVALASIGALLLALQGCGKKSSSSKLSSCTPPSGSPWVPAVTGAGASNHNSSVAITQTTTSVASVPLSGWNDPVSGSRLVAVSIPMSNDLGPLGSLSLSAQVSGIPASLQGAFHPLLVSLNDGTNELINVAITGAAGDCAAAGMAGANCKINTPSAYQDISHWYQRQLRSGGATASQADTESLNVFPTCSWTGGSAGPGTAPNCAFTSTFFTGSPARLRYGASYTAKYFLVADPCASTNAQGQCLTYGSVSGYNATLNVTAVYKTNPGSTLGGAVDVNIILVGSQNVSDSHTAKGQQNLNLMMQTVQNVFTQTATDPASSASYSPGVKLGTINVTEWGCDTGGDSYATADPNDIGAVLKAGSAALPASFSGKVVNVFLISQLSDPSILGVDGAIGGTFQNGTPSSGMVVPTLGKLGTYNPGCTLSSCPLSSQDPNFAQMGYTIAHEMGHFLGLNHPSEADASMHDIILDTPAHTALSNGYLTIGSVLNSDANAYMGTGATCHAACTTYNSALGVFCPAVFECGFNHLMWWSSKHIDVATSTADGNLVSLDSAKIINYNPFVQ